VNTVIHHGTMSFVSPKRMQRSGTSEEGQLKQSANPHSVQKWSPKLITLI